MLRVWDELLPELQALAKQAEEQAQHAVRASATVNRLIGTHTAAIREIAKALAEPAATDA
jgi:hypothetical protein